jgi:DNA-binding transcriptional regulator YhcF (GntR family)
MTNTIQFTLYPFTHKGINFVSRISQESRQAGLIASLGEKFIQMNKDAVDEILEITDETTKEQLESMIAFINEGGTEMFLELAGE